MTYAFPSVSDFYDAVLRGFEAYGKEGAFVSLDAWARNATSAEILFIDEEDLYLEDDEADSEDGEGDVPAAVRHLGYDYLLVGSDLVSVMVAFNRSGRTPTADALARAVNHYREFDTFDA